MAFDPTTRSRAARVRVRSDTARPIAFRAHRVAVRPRTLDRWRIVATVLLGLGLIVVIMVALAIALLAMASGVVASELSPHLATAA